MPYIPSDWSIGAKVLRRSTVSLHLFDPLHKLPSKIDFINL